MGKESVQSVAPLKEQVAADHSRDAAQLKAEHGKEKAALKAEEAQLMAAQKAEHAKTPGKTGLLAKLTGKEDPIKKAEKQELKAEMARAEELTKAEHDAENAHLKANRTTDMSAVNAIGGSHNHALPAAGAIPGGMSTEGIPDKKIYNHATGQHGQAALLADKVKHDHGIAAFADNGLGERHHSHHHSHRDGEYNGGLNQGPNLGRPQDGLAPVDQGHGFTQGQGFPQGQAFNQGGFNQGQAFPQGQAFNQGGFNQGQAFPQGQAFNQGTIPTAIPAGQPIAMSSAPQSVPLSTGVDNVAVIAPHHGGNRL